MKRVALTRKAPIGCEIVDGKTVRKKPAKIRVRKKTRAANSKSAPSVKELDRLWSLVVRTRAKSECQLWKCGDRQCGNLMDAHHIFGRGMSVRWDLRNGICLCKGHHLYYVHSGNNQAAAQEDIRDLVGAELYEELRQLHHQVRKNTAAYRQEVYAVLKAAIEDPFYSDGRDAD